MTEGKKIYRLFQYSILAVLLGERGQHPQVPSLYHLLLYQIQFAGTVSVLWQCPMSLHHISGLPNAGAPPFPPSTPDSVNMLCT